MSMCFCVPEERLMRRSLAPTHFSDGTLGELCVSVYGHDRLRMVTSKAHLARQLTLLYVHSLHIRGFAVKL